MLLEGEPKGPTCRCCWRESQRALPVDVAGGRAKGPVYVDGEGLLQQGPLAHLLDLHPPLRVPGHLQALPHYQLFLLLL